MRIVSKRRALLLILDKLVILLLYLVVLTQEPSVLGIPLKKAIFFLTLMIFGFLLLVSRRKLVEEEVLAYILSSLLLLVSLGLYGLANGNPLSNILAFLTPAFFVLYIPNISILIDEFGMEKYLRTIMYAALILSFFIQFVVAVVLWFKLYNSKYIIEIFNQSQKNVAISFPAGVLSVRVQVNSAIMIAPGVLAAYYFLKRTSKTRYLFALVIMLVSLVWTQSVGIWGGTLAAFGSYHLMINRLKPETVFHLTVMIIVALLLFLALFFLMGPSKMNVSVDAKIEQTKRGMGLFLEHPLLGTGLGYEYRNMDFRHTTDKYLEVAPVMLLSSLGLIGSFMYGFIFLYWPIRYLRMREKTKVGNLLFASEVAVLVASVANPYIWSGSIGLLFPSLLAGYVTRGKRYTQSRSQRANPIPPKGFLTEN